MLGQVISQVLNHNEQAISKEAFRLWKANPVTQQLLYDTANAVLYDLSDPLPSVSIADVGGIALAREAARNTALQVLEWSPAELEDEK